MALYYYYNAESGAVKSKRAPIIDFENQTIAVSYKLTSKFNMCVVFTIKFNQARQNIMYISYFYYFRQVTELDSIV